MNSLFKLTAAATLVAGAMAATSAQAEQRLYIPLGSAGEILVVDTATDRAIATITGTPEVHGLGGSPAAKYMVAGSYAEEVPKGSGIPPKPKGMSEAEHLSHHAKPAKTTSGEAKHAKPEPGGVSYLSLISTSDSSVTRRVEVPGAVHHVLVLPSGKTAVATHPDPGGISIVDLDTGEVRGPLYTGPFTNYAVSNRDGSLIYVSNANNGTISEVDTQSWIVRRNILAGETPEHMVLAPGDKQLYVIDADAGAVLEVDLKAGEVTKSSPVGGQLHGIGLSDDGRTLFVSAMEQEKLVAIGLKDGAMRSAILAPAPYHLTTAPGSGKLYVTSAEEPRVWVVTQDGLRVTGEIPIRGEGHQMTVLTH